MHPLLQDQRQEVIGRAHGRTLALDGPGASGDDASEHDPSPDHDANDASPEYDSIVSIDHLAGADVEELTRLRGRLEPDGRLLFLEPGDAITARLWAAGWSVIDVHRIDLPRHGRRPARWVRGVARHRRAEPRAVGA